MLFNSYAFILVFLPVTLAGYYLAGRHRSTLPPRLWLIGASLFYYGWWNPHYLALILASLFGNYILARGIASVGPERRLRKGLLATGVTLNLVALGWFKYANFFVDTLYRLGAISWTLEKILLPLAISFFTFQQIAFLVDTHRGHVKSCRFVDYALFVCFFPQLIAGPIVHHGEMMPQFARKETYRLHPPFLALGFTLFTLGLFKKVIFADPLGIHASRLFEAASQASAFTVADAWGGALAYSWQLYFDFSGYSDMAIGLALLFGIRLPFNFHSPYKAADLADFWRRWHMTLSRFLRDYLYIPLGGNRVATPRRSLNLLVTMTLGGLWHGAGWTFMAWGVWHGFFLCLNALWQDTPHRLRIPAWMRQAFVRGLTLFVVVLGWVLFRAADTDDAWLVIRTLLGNGDPDAPALLQSRVWSLVLPLCVLGLFFPNTQEITGLCQTQDRHPLLHRLRWQPTRTWAIVIALLFLFSLISLSTYSEFLYYQF